MAVKRALTGIIMTIWTFISMVIIPLSTLKALENGITLGGVELKIRLFMLNVGLIFILGLIAMMLTAFSYSFGGKTDAFITMAKYGVVAYYEWVWAMGVRKMEVLMHGEIVHVGIDLGVWIIIVILGSLLTGFLKAVHKYLEAKKKEKEEEEEEEEKEEEGEEKGKEEEEEELEKWLEEE